MIQLLAIFIWFLSLMLSWSSSTRLVAIKSLHFFLHRSRSGICVEVAVAPESVIGEDWQAAVPDSFFSNITFSDKSWSS